ncbi:iron-containing redox enzyme family protein [Streptacidiphilus sp. 4-A2]|nr:iron-containing redox enzyme family protein [Streptacidiphilus sp. 4-A2]
MRVYFTAHVKIDPRHSRELSDGMRLRARSSPRRVRDILQGAHLASDTGRRQFDHMLTYLRRSPRGSRRMTTTPSVRRSPRHPARARPDDQELLHA